MDIVYTHRVKVGSDTNSGTIRAYIEEYLPEDPRFQNQPFGMRLENGNFIWCPLEKIERIKTWTNRT